VNVFTDDAHVAGTRVPVRVRNLRMTYSIPAVVWLRDAAPRVATLIGEVGLTMSGVQAMPEDVEADLVDDRLMLHHKGQYRREMATVYVDIDDGSQLGVMVYY